MSRAYSTLSPLEGNANGLELLCGQGIWVYKSFVSRVAGCVLDYHGCGLVIFIYEGEISLDSDSGDSGLSWRPWTTCCFRRDYVSPFRKILPKSVGERITVPWMQ